MESPVYRLRESLGLSQSEFGQSVGRTQAAVSKWEGSGNPPPYKSALAIARRYRRQMDALGIELSDLIVGRMPRRRA